MGARYLAVHLALTLPALLMDTQVAATHFLLEDDCTLNVTPEPGVLEELIKKFKDASVDVCCAT